MDGWSGLGSINCIGLWDGVISFFRPLPDGFSSNHVWMRELEYKESWALKNWCFWTVVLEKTVESPCKEAQPVHPKENQSWIFTGRTMLKLKLQNSCHLMWRADSLEKTLMLGKIERRRSGWKRMSLEVWKSHCRWPFTLHLAFSLHQREPWTWRDPLCFEGAEL